MPKRTSVLGIPMDNLKMSTQKYKRTTFEEGDCDDDTVNGDTAGTSSTVPSVGYQMTVSAWKQRTLLEKLLLIILFLLVVVVIILSAIVGIQHVEIQHTPAANYCLTPTCITVSSSILNSMDPTKDPCEDFYQYACGGWIKSHPIPSGHSRWSTFGVLWKENEVVLKNALEKPFSSFKSEAEKKAKRYYMSCMDETGRVEKLGAQPMLDLIRSLGGWKISSTSGSWNVSTFDLNRFLQEVTPFLVNAFFSWGVMEDDKNSSRNILMLDQGGLTLSNWPWYLTNKTIQDEEHLGPLLNFMTKVGHLLGGPSDGNATYNQFLKLIEFEVKIANITTPGNERRDEEKLYHKLKISELSDLTPVIHWLDFFNAALSPSGHRVSLDTDVVVYAPEYLLALNDLLNVTMQTEEGNNTLHNYMMWKVVQKLVPYLSSKFRDALKEFKDILGGVKGQDSTWKKCVSKTDATLGFPLGAMFVNEAFHGDSKEKAEKMIDEVKGAFKKNLPYLKWMDNPTRKAAKEKVNAIIDMIGFPSYIQDPVQLDKKYEQLNISEDQYFQNYVNILQFINEKRAEKLFKLPNKTSWEMTPPTVNAYYEPTRNEIVFPAGILQAPFYDRRYPKSLNFGAMGVVMGHELTHGFDDQGRQYDMYGNLHQWWNNASIAKFKERTQCLVDQYSAYTVDGNHVDGVQTLGENIADNGGLKSAYHAYEHWLSEHGEELPIPGLNMTHRQLFFLGFAQVWCSSSTKQQAKQQLELDSHSPGMYRVIGTLSNSKEFAEQFNCKPGSRLNPKKKCEVW